MGNSRVLQDADNQLNSGFGWRESTGSFHEGDDLVKWQGQLAPVIAHSDGVVELAVRNIPGYLKGSYGNEVIIKHNAREKTHYAHLKYNSVNNNLTKSVGTVTAANISNKNTYLYKSNGVGHIRFYGTSSTLLSSGTTHIVLSILPAATVSFLITMMNRKV